jgi:ABC-2 type transport system ATP-binding protein
MIQVRDLRVDYDDVCAVSDLSLEIPPGEVYGLIGPNGAGKTTTIRTMMGLLEPTYGEILLNGVDVATHREKALLQVGFMPDTTPLYEDLKVWEYLDLFAASYRIPEEKRSAAISKYLEMVDLTEKRDALTAGLSRGMRQRLILAKTLLPEPTIVLLDEPASGMDPHGRVLLRNILRQLGAEGKTVLISSHILSELSDFCTSIGVMEKGRLVVTGRVGEISAHVLGKARVRLELLSGADRCAQLLAETRGISEVRQDGNHFTFASDGTPEEDSDLLAALITAGVRLLAYGREKENLEELFMKIGAKEVS